MSNKPKDRNATPDDAGELRGGTQGGSAAPLAQPGGPAGGTNALSPTGTARPGTVPEPPTGDKSADERQDPHRAVEGGRTKPSPDEAKQRARDEAGVAPEASRPGHDEGNPRQIPPDAPPP
jgi:hypothetical protein